MLEAWLDPRIWPESQFGMAVTGVRSRGSTCTVTTTGARFSINTDDNTLFAEQRLGRRRQCVSLRFGDHLLRGLRPHLENRGAAFLSGPGIRLRVNGDSLVMLQAMRTATVKGHLHFDPGWVAVFQGHQLFLDPFGGCGVYPMTDVLQAQMLDTHRRFRYELKAGDILWFAIFPPRPFDWKASLNQRIVWHWSRENGYPAGEDLRAWREFGNVYLLQSEVMLWKDWNLAYQPRDDAALRRVLDTVHDLDGRILVYTSPGYFLKGTPLAVHAMNSFESFRGWPPTVVDSANLGEFVQAITRMKQATGVDGIYFDGLYVKSVAASYQVMREARRLVGDDGLLMVHSTSNAPGGDVFLPAVDTYADFLLRGESSAVRYSDAGYLRYFVSGYNIGNAIGFLCNNNDHPTTPALVERVLDANVRLSRVIAQDTPERAETLRKLYLPRLTPALRQRVEAAAEAASRQASERFRQRTAAKQAEGKPWRRVFAESFDGPLRPDIWHIYTTPIEGTTLAPKDGALLVRARAHTVAYLWFENQHDVLSVQCRLRIGANSGLSWGPAITLMWPGYFFRVTARADGSFGIDRPGGVQDMVGQCRLDVWQTLRVKVGASDLICDVSNDEGHTWHHLWTEPWRGTAWADAPSRIILGKLSLWGDNTNNESLGDWGETWIGDVEVSAPTTDTRVRQR